MTRIIFSCYLEGKKMPVRGYTVFFLLITLGSCTFSAPQFESVITSVTGGKAPREAVGSTNIWTAEIVGSPGSLVRLFRGGPHGFVFLSSDNEAISFDGWVVRAVAGIGLESSVEVVEVAGSRVFKSSGLKDLQVQCGDWGRSEQGEKTIWRQRCSDQMSDNIIEVNQAGNVARIVQTIDATGRVLILQKLSASG
jgi:hypothetical protein